MAALVLYIAIASMHWVELWWLVKLATASLDSRRLVEFSL